MRKGGEQLKGEKEKTNSCSQTVLFLGYKNKQTKTNLISHTHPLDSLSILSLLFHPSSPSTLHPILYPTPLLYLYPRPLPHPRPPPSPPAITPVLASPLPFAT